MNKLSSYFIDARKTWNLESIMGKVRILQLFIESIFHLPRPKNLQGYALSNTHLLKETVSSPFHNPNVSNNLFLLTKCEGKNSNIEIVYAAVKGITAHREAMKNTSKLRSIPCYFLISLFRMGALC